MGVDLGAARWPSAAAGLLTAVVVAGSTIVATAAPAGRPVSQGPRIARSSGRHRSPGPRATTVPRATTSRAARRESLRAIPLDRLDGNNLERVRYVLAHTTIYRRMPTKVIDCDPQLFVFLVRHPHVIVNIWEVLGISNVALEPTADGAFLASDGHGTLGRVEFLTDEPNRQLIYAEGKYEGPMFKIPVRARCVLLMRSRFSRGADGRQYVTAQLDGFIHVDQAAADLLVRAFQPLVGRTADYNFTETMAFVGNLSRTTERNPLGVERLYRRLRKVEPETRRRLVEISRNLAAHSARTNTTGALDIGPPQAATQLAEAATRVERGD